MQSLEASNTHENIPRDNSLEGEGLPTIHGKESIRIKNKVYTLVDKFPGKAQF